MGGGIEVGTVWIWKERGVCALGGECNRSKNGRNRDDFPIGALNMCWSIFQRVLGWKRAVSFRNALLVSRLCDRNTGFSIG